jgi:hypothetical protein
MVSAIATVLSFLRNLALLLALGGFGGFLIWISGVHWWAAALVYAVLLAAGVTWGETLPATELEQRAQYSENEGHS